MHNIYLGMLGKNLCSISDTATNRSILITGISGSGKTCRLQQIELDAVQNGYIVIVLDTSCSHDSNQIYNPIRSDYETLCKRISASQDGIDFDLFSSSSFSHQQTSRIINDVTQVIANSSNLGQRQTKILRKAVATAYNNYTPGKNEIQLIGDNLINLECDGEDLYNRLWVLFQCDALRPCKYQFEQGKINIITISDFDPATQKIIAEMFLSSVWNNRRTISSDNTNLIIVLDECQRLYLGSNSVTCQILREGRKYGINLILATQSLSIFPKSTVSMLEQAGTKLYFQPAQSDVRRIAKSLEQAYGVNWQQTLSRLRRGESVTDGILQIGTLTTRRSLILT